MSFAVRSLLCVLVLLAAAAPAAYAAGGADPQALPPVKVQDLCYGDVLFHYWADQDSGLEALTRLEAYQHWGLMPHHKVDAELLAAGIYLQLGMHNEAGRRFAALLNGSAKVPVTVRNRAWFYLAKIWYERGYYDRSEQALARIQGRLPPDMEGERHNLLVNALMRQKRYDDAIRALRSWQGSGDWMAFARFNLGVALVRTGRLADAEPILAAVGTRAASGQEMAALRDRANLALGFAELQAGQPAAATVALARVRLTGPYSSRALLADGWAEAALGDYREALAPWMQLQRRSLLDAAVQESYLAVPYAFSQLNAGAQAARYYQTALQSFDSEAVRIGTAIGQVKQGGLLEALAHGQSGPQQGWFWQLKTLPDSPQSRYLYELLADNDFQEGLKNYRDLVYLQHSLSGWDGTMDAFAAMLAARSQAYAERVPKADALLATDAPARLSAMRADAESRLAAIETGDDVVALATPKERDQWNRIERLRALIGRLPPGPQRDHAAERLRLVRGVLLWRLDAAFKGRAYREQRALHDIDRSLDELQNRWVRVRQARDSVPHDNGAFAARVTALAARINRLHARLASAERAQANYLQGLAEAQLQAQQQRVTAYAQQARFALADLYDRAASTTAQPASSGAAAIAPQAVPVPQAVPAPAGAGQRASTGARP